MENKNKISENKLDQLLEATDELVSVGEKTNKIRKNLRIIKKTLDSCDTLLKDEFIEHLLDAIQSFKLIKRDCEDTLENSVDFHLTVSNLDRIERRLTKIFQDTLGATKSSFKIIDLALKWTQQEEKTRKIESRLKNEVYESRQSLKDGIFLNESYEKLHESKRILDDDFSSTELISLMKEIEKENEKIDREFKNLDFEFNSIFSKANQLLDDNSSDSTKYLLSVGYLTQGRLVRLEFLNSIKIISHQIKKKIIFDFGWDILVNILLFSVIVNILNSFSPLFIIAGIYENTSLAYIIVKALQDAIIAVILQFLVSLSFKLNGKIRYWQNLFRLQFSFESVARLWLYYIQVKLIELKFVDAYYKIRKISQ